MPIGGRAHRADLRYLDGVAKLSLSCVQVQFQPANAAARGTPLHLRKGVIFGWIDAAERGEPLRILPASCRHPACTATAITELSLPTPGSVPG